MPSEALEEYLETIYRLSSQEPARPGAIAAAMDVSPATVTAALRRLSERGWVHRPKGGVVLTDEGRREALAIVRRHRLSERFLVDVLGLPLDTAHEEACRLEHALSDEVLAALERFLDSPESCPHGHPIPDATLAVADAEGTPLADLATGERASVVSLDERDEGALTYLTRSGIVPKASLVLDSRNPVDGTLLVHASGRLVTIGLDLAEHVRVSRIEDS